MFCQNCGANLAEGTNVCTTCGTPLATHNPSIVQYNPQPQGAMQHNEPRCGCCGYVGQWKVEPIFLTHHWIIFFISLFFFGAGIFYLLTVLIIRGNTEHRAKICPQCKARNMWSFYY